MEGFDKVGMGAVGVEVVGIGGGDDSHVGMQLQEGTVILVGLHHHIFTLVVDMQIAAEVLADATQKGRTPAWSLA